MDKMKETCRIVFMLMFLIFYYWNLGVNINIFPYESADPELPHVVTVDGRTVSLLSGDHNLNLALGNNFVRSNMYYEYHKLVNVGHGYLLDPSGMNPDSCRIYNGITTASTKAELENAFGEDCIKTDHYFTEIFFDDEEADYEKIDLSAFDGKDIYSWFIDAAPDFSEAKYITLLTCYYNDNHNDIEFIIYDTENGYFL